MQNLKTIPRLCGGTFFTLLRNACKEKLYEGTETVNVKDSDIFLSLYEIYRPSFNNDKPATLKNYTSSFKSCGSMKRNKLHFDNVEDISTFNTAFKENYDRLFTQMSQLLSCYILNEKKARWLINALVEVIALDSTIQDDDLLCVGVSGTILSKSEIVSSSRLPVAAFLLGVWHFIILNRRDNTVGAETYNSWHAEARPQTKRVFISSIGSDVDKEVIIDYQIKNDIANIALSNTEDLNFNQPSSVNHRNEQFDDDPYFRSARSEYSSMKTLLYNTAEVPFYSFFECNDIGEVDLYDDELGDFLIHNCTIAKLAEISNFIILTGNGGIGKSMMMRHLLLDSIINRTETYRLPILMEMRNYEPQSEELDDYIYKEYLRLHGNMGRKKFDKMLEDGRLALLFDGLDEINQQDFRDFSTKLNDLIIKHEDNVYILSSRPFIRFIHLHKFATYAIYPLSKQQALSLIDKLEYKPNKPYIKDGFRNEVDNTLFITHKEFCQNPLLLTLMLMMYELFAHIPSRMHLFYKQAYLTLASRHNEIIDSDRSLSTGLNIDQFEDVFAEFCARSYYDECYSLSETDIRRYYDELNSLDDLGISPSCSDFIHDVKDNLCLMNLDGYHYSFMHRSFQEYFCALHFSKSADSNLYETGRFFDERMDYSVSDNTFSMLYDMIPKKVERYIFFKYLDEMFKRCNNDYWLFLADQYESIFYWEGSIDEDDIEPVEAKSYIYREFCNIHGFTHRPIQNPLPGYAHFLLNHYYYVDKEKWDDVIWIDEHRLPWGANDAKLSPDDPVIMAYSRIEPGYFEVFEEIPAGNSYRIQASVLIDYMKRGSIDCNDLLDALESDSFPLKAEFNAVKKYYSGLKEKFDRQPQDQRSSLFND